MTFENPSDPPGYGLTGSAGPAPILGLDNVALDLSYAGVGTRSLAMMIDGAVLAILSVIWISAVFSVHLIVEVSAAWLWAIGALGVFLLQWGYFSACEILMDGQTPGKRLLSLQTVSHLGGKPSAGALIIRNLLRSVDYLLGVFFMALDPQSRRLGDMVASTLVVHRGNLKPKDDFRLGRVPDGWGAKDVVLVESFLRRAARMEAEIAEKLAGRLLEWIEKTEPAFVQEVEDRFEALQESSVAPMDVQRLCVVLGVEATDGKR